MNLTSPPISSLTRDHGRGHNAAIWIDQVYHEQFDVSGFGGVAKLDRINLGLEDLVIISTVGL